MKKIDQLLVRACKSQHPYKRVHSIYRRFYTVASNEPDFNIAILLSRIADNYLVLKPSELLSATHPANRIYYGADESDEYWTVVVKLLISKIAMTPTSRLPGLTHPLKFRTLEVA